MTALPLALFVGEWLPYSETFVYDQVQRQRRFTAHAFAKAWHPTTAQRFPYTHVTALRLPERLLYLGFGKAPTFTHAMRELKPKVVHAHFGTNGALAMPFARAADAPLVVTFHGHDVSGLFPQNRFTLRYGRYQLYADAMLDHASLLLCASQELATLLLERAPRVEQKVRVHRLGIDHASFQAGERTDGPLRVLMIGRMVEKKGMAYGIAAFARVRRIHVDASLTIVGDGPLRSELTRLVAALGLESRVRFLGALDPEGVHRELASAHVLLAPSVVAADGDRESGVLVIKEAGAAGLPTVATQHGGIPEIVEHGATGLLVAERDEVALADCLLALAGDPSLRKTMGAAARTKIAREYDTTVQNELLEQHLSSVL